MKLLFSMARPFHPHFTSGADLANFEFMTALSSRGARVRVLGLTPDGGSGRQEYTLGALEVELYDSLQALLDRTIALLRTDRPDRFLTGCPGDRGDNRFEQALLTVVGQAGVPALLIAPDIQETTRVYQGLHSAFSRVIANSRYTAGELRNGWGIDAEVIYPVPDRARCQRPEGRSQGEHLTMFNPIAPKGIRTTLMLAGFFLKDRQFLVVEGWLPLEALELRAELFPNVRFERRTHDVAGIYARTDCLLVPSIWQEPFGRVVLEAMFNHIPVAASAVGGIPEIIPDSPLLIQDYQDPQAWAERLRQLEDPAFRQAVVQYQLERAERFDFEREMDRLWEVVREG